MEAIPQKAEKEARSQGGTGKIGSTQSDILASTCRTDRCVFWG